MVTFVWVRKLFGLLLWLSGTLGLLGWPNSIPAWWRCLTSGGDNCPVGPIGWPPPFQAPDTQLIWNVTLLLIGLVLLFPNTATQLAKRGSEVLRWKKFPNVGLQVLQTTKALSYGTFAVPGSMLVTLGARLTNRTPHPVILGVEVVMELKRPGGGVDRVIFDPDRNPPPPMLTVESPSGRGPFPSPLNIPAYQTVEGFWALYIGRPWVDRADGLDGMAPVELLLTDHLGGARKHFVITQEPKQ